MNKSAAKACIAAIDLQTYQKDGKDEEGVLRLLLALREILRARKFTHVVCFGMNSTLPSQVTNLLQYMTYVAGIEVILRSYKLESEALRDTVIYRNVPVPPGVTTH